MTDCERFALAKKIQKRVQERQPHYWIIRRRDEIEKKIIAENNNRRSLLKIGSGHGKCLIIPKKS